MDEPFYLYELTANMSKRLNSYALSFHFHDDDLLLYNLDKDGQSLDGYNSNYQYFFQEPVDPNEVLSQRHDPICFRDLMPVGKDVETLNEILNEGYWNAFDNDKLDEDGVPEDEYFIDEEERFIRVGKYLEIYAKDDYPFADWKSNISNFNLTNSYLLKASQ